MNGQSSISIFGSGAVGTALLDFFNKEEYQIRSVWDRKAGNIYSGDNGSQYQSEQSLPSDESELGELIFIAVPDDQIELISEQLSKVPIQWDRRSIVHCSGNMSSDVCSSLQKKGAQIAAMHPIQTFKKGDSSIRFKDIYITLEGDSELLSTLTLIVNKMGANPVLITPEQKRVIHIASVIASNYLVALLNVSNTLLEDAEIKNKLDILQPLVMQTVHNIFEKGVDQALTGPISRGDIESVRAHLDVLKESSIHRSIYKILGLEALNLAIKNESISEEKAKSLHKLFKKD